MTNKIVPADLKEIAAVISDPEYVTYCSLAMRIGVRAWMTEIEYTKFRPGTLDNDDFHLAIMKWPDDAPLYYLVICFHKSEQQFAESILWKNGIRKVTEGFTQMMMSPGGKVEKFPLEGPNVFFLENHTQGAPNVIYSNDPTKMQAARDLEDQQCQVFFDAHALWCETDEGKAAIAEYLKEHPGGHNI